MKRTKTSAAPQEACGVWLDPAELRGKKPKPHPTRPISKLLNAFAPSGGYSVAVALNFTQTRMQMPATRQTSINSFFLPQQQKEKDPASSEPCSDLSPPATCIHGRANRKHCTAELKDGTDYVTHEDMLEREADRDCVPSVELSSQAASQQLWATPEHPPPPLLAVKYQTEEDEEEGRPAQKMRRNSRSLILGETGVEQIYQQPVAGCAQPDDTHVTAGTLQSDLFTHDSEGNRVLAHQDTSTEKAKSHWSLLDDLGSEVFFGVLWGEAQTSTRRRQRFPTPRTKKEVKENSPSAGARGSGTVLGSPRKQTSYSLSSQSSRKGSCLSPWKPAPLHLQEEGRDSYATLFTQDSQGQRVIAHRNFQPRSPLKDQTNWASSKGGSSHVRVGAFNTLLGEDSDLDVEMLFTQDSQGNMVIRH